jgi:hypothetical protein
MRTASNSARLFVVAPKGRPIRPMEPSGNTITTPAPPGPEFPLQHPSVHTCIIHIPLLVQLCSSGSMRRSTIETAFLVLLGRPFLTKDRGRGAEDSARDPFWRQRCGHQFAGSQLACQRHSDPTRPCCVVVIGPSLCEIPLAGTPVFPSACVLTVREHGPACARETLNWG